MQMETKKTFRQRLVQMKDELKLFSLKEKKETLTSSRIEVEEIYNHVTYISSLCEQLIDIRRYKKELQEDIKELQKKQQMYRKYESLPKGNKQKVENLWVALQSAESERETLRHQFSDGAFVNLKLQKYEEEMPGLLREIKEMEEQQRKTKTDIDYLEGEKAALQFSKEKLQQAQVMSRKVAIGLVMGLAFVALILLLLYTVYEWSMVVSGSILTVLGLFLGTWLYIFRRRVIYELQKNMKMQNRAVELLNKTKLRYVHYTRFLEYEYQKFGVHNSHMLQHEWDLYSQNQKNRNQYQQISSQKSQLEKAIWDEMNHNSIGEEEVFYEEMKDLLNPDARADRVFEFNMKYKKLETEWEESLLQEKYIQKELEQFKRQEEIINDLPKQLLEKYREAMDK